MNGEPEQSYDRANDENNSGASSLRYFVESSPLHDNDDGPMCSLSAEAAHSAGGVGSTNSENYECNTSSDNKLNTNNDNSDNDTNCHRHGNSKSDGSWRRIYRNYLSIIGIALFLTVCLPGTRLWKSPCIARSPEPKGKAAGLKFGNEVSFIRQQSLEFSFDKPSPSLNSNSTLHDRHRDHYGSTVLNSWSLSDEQDNNNNNGSGKAEASAESNNESIFFLFLDRSSYYGKIDTVCFTKLFLLMLLLIISFVSTQGSDPGYLASACLGNGHILDNRAMSNYEEDEMKCAGDDIEYRNNTDLEMTSFLQSHTKQTPKNVEPPPTNHFPTPTPKATASPQTSSLSSRRYLKPYPHSYRKSCHFCNIARPPLRSHHCQRCNRCVATFDHHCIFLDTCIGERNHCRFYCFVLLNLLTVLYGCWIIAASEGVGMSLKRTYRHGDVGNDECDFRYTPTKLQIQAGSVVFIATKIYFHVLLAFAFLLCVINTLTVFGNVTAFECGKGQEHIDYLKGANRTDFPFSVGCFGNVKLFCCRDDAARFILRVCRYTFHYLLRRPLTCLSRCCAPLCANRRDEKLTFCNLFNHCRPCSINNDNENDEWMPVLWKLPDLIDREPEDWWNHPWQNKYWSCC